MKRINNTLKLAVILTLTVGMVAGIACTTSTSASDSTGIQFADFTFQKAKTEAKETGKIIFMDAHAVWCGPCKKMARDVFTNDQVAKYFNDNFINLKIDMEKGEGVSLSRTYSVEFYPTLFFIDGDGKVVKKAIGYHNADQLLSVAKEVVANN